MRLKCTKYFSALEEITAALAQNPHSWNGAYILLRGWQGGKGKGGETIEEGKGKGRERNV